MRARRRGTSSTVYIWVHEQRGDESNAAIIGFAPVNSMQFKVNESCKKYLFRYFYLLAIVLYSLNSCKPTSNLTQSKAITDGKETLGVKITTALVSGKSVPVMEFVYCKLPPEKWGEIPPIDNPNYCVNPFLDAQGQEPVFLLAPISDDGGTSQAVHNSLPTERDLAFEGYGKLAVSFIGSGVAMTVGAFLLAKSAIAVSTLAASSTLLASLTGLELAGIVFTFQEPLVKGAKKANVFVREKYDQAMDWGKNARILSKVWSDILKDNWHEPKKITMATFGDSMPENASVFEVLRLTRDFLGLQGNEKIQRLLSRKKIGGF
ncbi:MAG: hypothetical protein R3B45_02495 [Bdellovibrionota bacterium]